MAEGHQGRSVEEENAQVVKFRSERPTMYEGPGGNYYLWNYRDSALYVNDVARESATAVRHRLGFTSAESKATKSYMVAQLMLWGVCFQKGMRHSSKADVWKLLDRAIREGWCEYVAPPMVEFEDDMRRRAQGLHSTHAPEDLPLWADVSTRPGRLGWQLAPGYLRVNTSDERWNRATQPEWGWRFGFNLASIQNGWGAPDFSPWSTSNSTAAPQPWPMPIGGPSFYPSSFPVFDPASAPIPVLSLQSMPMYARFQTLSRAQMEGTSSTIPVPDFAIDPALLAQSTNTAQSSSYASLTVDETTRNRGDGKVDQLDSRVAKRPVKLNFPNLPLR